MLHDCGNGLSQLSPMLLKITFIYALSSKNNIIGVGAKYSSIMELSNFSTLFSAKKGENGAVQFSPKLLVRFQKKFTGSLSW